MHRVHRALGSVGSLLLVVWFASGAVMTFADFPRFADEERLASAQVLPAGSVPELPPTMRSALERGGDIRARLAMMEGAPTWLFTQAGVRRALRARAPFEVAPLDETRARAEAMRRLGTRVRDAAPIDAPDQWSVGLAPTHFPLWRVSLDDEAETQLYLSAQSGEIVQASTHAERALAWVGAIPHWIYPTLLRRERALWRQVVLALSVAGLVITLSGLVAGLHVRRATRGRGVRDRYLRLHQALGLSFGLLACSWLLSGALSLTPFAWSGPHAPSAREARALHEASRPIEPSSVQRALALCQAVMQVAELEITALGDARYAVCAAPSGDTRVVDLAAPGTAPERYVARARLEALARRLADGTPHTFTIARAYDDYHYPTHASPHAALPFARIDLADATATSFYVDPARARLIGRHSTRTRLERWLYHGLHSLDLPALYRHPALWRTIVLVAMTIGVALAALGLLMSLRRVRRGFRRRRRDAPRTPRVTPRVVPAQTAQEGTKSG